MDSTLESETWGPGTMNRFYGTEHNLKRGKKTMLYTYRHFFTDTNILIILNTYFDDCIFIYEY